MKKSKKEKKRKRGKRKKRKKKTEKENRKRKIKYRKERKEKKEKEERADRNRSFHNRTHKTFLLVACVETHHSDISSRVYDTSPVYTTKFQCTCKSVCTCQFYSTCSIEWVAPGWHLPQHSLLFSFLHLEKCFLLLQCHFISAAC